MNQFQRCYSFNSLLLVLCILTGYLEGGPANGKISDRYVTVRTNYDLANNYQLGNQLFCIATALAYAWEHNFILVFPFLKESGANRRYNREHIFFRLDTVCPREIQTIYYDMSWKYKPIPIFDKDLMLVGPFMSWRYFHQYREQILDIFSPSSDILSYLYAKYGELIENPHTVGVHVRTFDKNTHASIPFVGLTYFGLAMEHFPAHSIFVIFSDRIKWCEKHFKEKFPQRNFIFIEGNDHIQDLFLLSKMHNHILSNSTFSWWAAYLNAHPHGRVCVPEKWFAPCFEALLDDIYLPEWIRIPHDIFKDLYPEDMYWYDEKSQSVDNVSN
jgi:hypothetical protein